MTRWLIVIVLVIVSVQEGKALNLGWSRIMDQGESDEIWDAVVDSGGNIYLAGRLNNQFAVISLTSTGTVRWTYTTAGNEPYEDHVATSITLDNNGHVYAAGYVYNLGYGFEMVIVSLNAATGNLRWKHVYDGPGGQGIDKFWDIVIGEDGNIYATGTWDANPSTHDNDLIIMSFTPDGTKRFEFAYNSPWSKDDIGRVIHFYRDRVYVAGYSEAENGKADAFVIAIDTAGSDTLWTYRYNGAGNDFDAFFTMKVDEEGNVYASGQATINSFDKDVLVCKLDSAGTLLWRFIYGYPDNKPEGVADLVISPENTIYIGGYLFYSDWSSDFLLIKMTQDGDTVWTKYFGGSGDQEIKAMVMQEDTLLYFTGISRDSIYVAVMDSGGNITDSALYSPSSNLSSSPTSLVYSDYTGALIISGIVINNQSYTSDGIVLSYPITASISSIPPVSSCIKTLYLPADLKTFLKLRKNALLIDRNGRSYHSLIPSASGIYFLFSKNSKKVYKIVKLK